MHEFGNYLGTLEFSTIPLEVDEEYEKYLSTLNREELEEELLIIKAQKDALDKMEF